MSQENKFTNREITIIWTDGTKVVEYVPSSVLDIDDLNLFIEWICIQHKFYNVLCSGKPEFFFHLEGHASFNGSSLCWISTLEISRVDKDLFPSIVFDDELMKIFGFTTLEKSCPFMHYYKGRVSV